MLFHKPDSADLAALSAWATVFPGASASEDYAHDEMTEYGAFVPDALVLCESAEGVAKVLGYCAKRTSLSRRAARARDFAAGPCPSTAALCSRWSV